MNWHMGKLLRIAETTVPAERPAVIEFNTGRELSWGDLARRGRNIARFLQDQGIAPADKIAFYSRNRIEYLEAVVTTLKTGGIHINVNYRYKHQELRHIFENSDAKVVFYNREYADTLAEIRDELPLLQVLVEIGGGDSAPAIAGAHAFDNIAETDRGDPTWSEGADDQFFMYTGGTTGLPKGVMWTQDTLFNMIGTNFFAPGGPRPPRDENEFRTMVEQSFGARSLVNAPFMHGMGIYSSLQCLFYGGTVVTNDTARFSPEDAWEAVEKARVNLANLPGDAMAKPLYEALEANPGRWNTESLKVMTSSAAVFSTYLKKGLIKHCPQLVIMDSLGGSESSAIGTSVMNKDNLDTVHEDEGLKLEINQWVKVFTEDFREVQPGSGERGMVARSGAIALGYYKDPEKTAKTFPVVDGVRYCMLGDWAEVLDDKSIKFLGRGNVCINSGGEKIFPEEVEQIVKNHQDVADCAVVGVPDERWGSAVTAVVQLEPGAKLSAAAIQDYVRDKLADYKVPKYVVAIEDMGRAPNGKLDYSMVKKYAEVQVTA
jgi:3-oxocholest-4-en-26-oate---CoA ligase